MSHRVQQILDAAAAAFQANANLRATVEVNRVRSLSEEQAEFPALTVNYGTDSPTEVVGDFESIGSALELILTAFFVGETEQEVLEGLLSLRTQTHISLMADQSLGLSFVSQITYGGADAPVLQQAERMLGAQTFRWTPHYTMNIDSPE